MFTLGLTNPEIANGKEGGVLLCTQACQASRESCEAGSDLVTLILPLQDCGRPPASWQHPSIHLHISSLSSDGVQLPTVTQGACSLSAGGGTEATAGPVPLEPAVL